jgi:hypothetical protein
MPCRRRISAQPEAISPSVRDMLREKAHVLVGYPSLALGHRQDTSVSTVSAVGPSGPGPAGAGPALTTAGPVATSPAELRSNDTTDTAGAAPTSPVRAGSLVDGVADPTPTPDTPPRTPWQLFFGNHRIPQWQKLAISVEKVVRASPSAPDRPEDGLYIARRPLSKGESLRYICASAVVSMTSRPHSMGISRRPCQGARSWSAP